MSNRLETEENLKFVQSQLAQLLNEETILTPKLRKSEGNDKSLDQEIQDIDVRLKLETLEDRKVLLQIQETRLLQELGKINNTKVIFSHEELLAMITKITDRLSERQRFRSEIRQIFKEKKEASIFISEESLPEKVLQNQPISEDDLTQSRKQEITALSNFWDKNFWDKTDRLVVMIAGGAALGSAVAQLPGAVIGGLLATAYGLYMSFANPKSAQN